MQNLNEKPTNSLIIQYAFVGFSFNLRKRMVKNAKSCQMLTPPPPKVSEHELRNS
jgi:hypothetical protein